MTRKTMPGVHVTITMFLPCAGSMDALMAGKQHVVGARIALETLGFRDVAIAEKFLPYYRPKGAPEGAGADW